MPGVGPGNGVKMPIGERKEEHIEISLHREVQFREKKSGFEDVGFEEVDLVYSALPEIDESEIDCRTRFLGKRFSAPLMVAAITGGITRAEQINKDIAKACEDLGIGMGLGSQRAMMDDNSLAYTYRVRDVAPGIFLAGNLGVTQAKHYGIGQIENALNSVGADALAIHVNAAQEAIQPGGTTDFSGALGTIRKISNGLRHGVYVKEVGAGISREVAGKIAKTGVKAIDVGGAGGTSWTEIEYLRAGEDVPHTFREFGVPTVASIIETRGAFKGQVVATGGVRSGLDVAKALALGADITGIALPVLKAQNEGGSEGTKQYLQRIIRETKQAMFLLGAKDIKQLKKKKCLLFGRTREWVEQRKAKVR